MIEVNRIYILYQEFFVNLISIYRTVILSLQTGFIIIHENVLLNEKQIMY